MRIEEYLDEYGNSPFGTWFDSLEDDEAALGGVVDDFVQLRYVRAGVVHLGQRVWTPRPGVLRGAAQMVVPSVATHPAVMNGRLDKKAIAIRPPFRRE